MRLLNTILIIASLFSVSCKKEYFFRDSVDSKISTNQESSPACKKMAEDKDSFYSCEGKIFDASGSEFIHRGVNMPLAYFKSESKADITKVVNVGFNSIRILWCADTLYAGGRCDAKDMHKIDELDEYLKNLEDNDLVSMLNLQNATGKDDESSLAKIVDYLTRDEIKEVLNKHKRNLQINIANEWHGKWANRSEGGKKWYEAYKRQLARLRSAGLEHQFVIDTCGWGQDPTCMYNYAEKLMEADSNIVFSAHVYDSLGKNKENIKKMYEFLREKKVPFLVGEFASTHYGKNVSWETVIDESTKEGHEYGFIAWSWSGNSSSLRSLDIISRSEFGNNSNLESRSISGLTSFGTSLLGYNGGIRNYTRLACTLVVTDLCLESAVIESPQDEAEEPANLEAKVASIEVGEDKIEQNVPETELSSDYYPNCYAARKLGYLSGSGDWGWITTRKGFSCKRDINVGDSSNAYPVCDSNATNKQNNYLHSMNGEWGYINGRGFSCKY